LTKSEIDVSALYKIVLATSNYLFIHHHVEIKFFVDAQAIGDERIGEEEEGGKEAGR
jgi:hypothetical protein